MVSRPDLATYGRPGKGMDMEGWLSDCGVISVTSGANWKWCHASLEIGWNSMFKSSSFQGSLEITHITPRENSILTSVLSRNCQNQCVLTTEFQTVPKEKSHHFWLPSASFFFLGAPPGRKWQGIPYPPGGRRLATLFLSQMAEPI